MWARINQINQYFCFILLSVLIEVRLDPHKKIKKIKKKIKKKNKYIILTHPQDYVQSI